MSQTQFLFETERLLIRPCDPTLDADVQASLSLYQTAAAQESFGPSVMSTTFDQVRAFLTQRWNGMWKPSGFGSFLIFKKPQSGEEPNMIGACSMVKEEGIDYPDVGYALLDEAIGKGYATEAASGLIKYAREQRGVTDITGFTRAENFASQKVLQALGFKHVATVTVNFEGAQQETIVYASGTGAEVRDERYYKKTVQIRLSKLERRGQQDKADPAAVAPVLQASES